jgi:hypothetical protein
MLKGTRLTGATERSFIDLNGRMTALWSPFDSHGKVVCEAREPAPATRSPARCSSPS